MRHFSFVGSGTALLGALLALINPPSTLAAALRPPAVPLVTFNPYLSIWSEADRLTDDVTRHWTRHEHPLVQALRVSGFVTGYELWPMTATGKAAIRPGKNFIAVHCHQTAGGQYVDLGLVDVLAE